MPKTIPVAKLSDVKPGECLAAKAGKITVALCNVNGTIHALDNTCPHAGGPLGEGFLDGDCVECPWHGWRYNVKTGERPENPEFKVDRYEVQIEGDTIRVVIP
jgi:nitrite reductase (NADH) small subunit/3-phenylpropionate/trans-cinnamate dioxygenase ferredoxin subunit